MTPVPTESPAQEETLWGFPIDYTHDAFEVPTGGKLGTVLVTVEIEDAAAEEFRFSVWSDANLEEPLQTMTASRTGFFRWKEVQDVNFDGYMDFGYMFFRGNRSAYWHYWVWSEEQGEFVWIPEFDQISCPNFDEETGVISGYTMDEYDGGAGGYTFHRWTDRGLVCVRRVTISPCGTDTPNEVQLTVEEPIRGSLIEVFRWETDREVARKEAEKWCDLAYHRDTIWGFPINDTHDAFEVPVGGELGTVIVTVEELVPDWMSTTTVSVWDPADLSAPIQVMDGKGFCHRHEFMDANFDGYMDVWYTQALSATNTNYALWVWDEVEKQFIDSGTFTSWDLRLDEEDKTLYNYAKGGSGCSSSAFYRWENGEMVEIRTIEVWIQGCLPEASREFVVEDRIDGEMVEVYRESLPAYSDLLSEEAQKWYRLDYHGT